MSEQQKPAAPLGRCIVEIMGHVQLAGYVTEEVRFGEALCRVDLPEVAAVPAKGDADAYWNPAARPAIPAFTRYYGGKAIYSITPTTEESARAFAASRRVEPPIRLEPVAPALGPVKDAEVEAAGTGHVCPACGEDIVPDEDREHEFECPRCGTLLAMVLEATEDGGTAARVEIVDLDGPAEGQG